MDKKTEEQYIAEIEELRKTNELYLTIMDGINENVYAIDENDIITLYNKHSEEAEGIHRSDILGRDEKEVYANDPIPYHTLVTEKIKNTLKPIINYPYAYHAQNGKYINVLLNAYPFLYNGTYSGTYVISHTLTQTIDTMDYIRNAQKLILSSQDPNGESVKGHTLDDIIAENKKMKDAIALAKRTALHDSSVMIIGETGSGKELFAQGIHVAGMRQGPFVPINCAAIPDNLLESTFFGTIKGAFTGAVDTPGLFEQAENGTLFLDEVNSMPATFQAKLLRAIQEKTIRRVGSPKEKEVNCRIICATNKDLWNNPEGFRADLLFRLSVVSLQIPPLRERRDDILLLAKHFIGKFNKTFHTDITEIDAELQRIMYFYDWPGNVRELENIIESAMNFVEEGSTVLHLDNFPEYYQERLLQYPTRPRKRDLNPLTLREAVDNYEKNYILDTLEENHWNISKAAEQLGMQRPNLYTKMKRYNIERPE